MIFFTFFFTYYELCVCVCVCLYNQINIQKFVFLLFSFFPPIILFQHKVFLTLYSPRGFDYNICTKQFEWKSIFKGAESLGLRGDYEVKYLYSS